ncbi:hypothetical protein GCM10028805_57330 [Spirosoma harenae]
MLALPVLAGGIAYYVLVHNLKEVIIFAIDKETEGGYDFQSNKLSLSILNRKVTIDGLTFARKDTANVPLYYTVRIPSAYLSVDSWRELLINKRLLVDSFSVVKPEIVIHDYRADPLTHHQTRFHTSSILENLQKTLDHLHAHSFNVQGGSFALFRHGSTAPFAVKDINLTVRNFSRIDNDNRRILGSDHIELALGRQKWVLSDGKNTLSFRGLHFISSTQLFEIDSIDFRKPATAEKGEMSLQAEKFFFNSTHLPAVYQKGELWLDTLICIRPVLNLPLERSKGKQRIVDTSGTIQANVKNLFKTVTIGYTAIKDGEILLGNKTSPISRGSSEQANVSIYNLTLNQNSEHSISTDSINLSLHHIAFFSPDSLFKIGVESFHMVRKDVIFRNVMYGTASQRIRGKGLTFKAPLLHLRNVSVEDLMQKRIVASAAELVQPSIVAVATKKAAIHPKPFVRKTAPPKKVDLFKTLHGLGEILEVDNFRIINANAQYKLLGDDPMEVSMKNMNATVYLNDFLVSDSLIDMKHAIPSLTIENARLKTRKVDVLLTKYAMEGKQHYNKVDQLQMNLTSGITFQANKLYWEAFAWDALQHSKDVQIDLLRVQNLAINANLATKKAKVGQVQTDSESAKPLPLVHIGRLVADHVNLKAALPKQTLAGFQGSAIQIDSLTTETGYIGWQQFGGKLTNLYVDKPGDNQLSVAQVDMNSRATTTFRTIRYGDNRSDKVVQLSLPQLRVTGLLNSTDFSTVRLHSVNIDQPIVMIKGDADAVSKTTSAKGLSLPFAFTLQELHVNGARVNYVRKKAADSIRVQTLVDIDAADLKGSKDGLTFDSWRVTPTTIALTSSKLNTVVPAATAQLTHGKVSTTKTGELQVTGHLQGKIAANELEPVLPTKKKTEPNQLSLGHIAATIDYPTFSWTAGKKIPWSTWMDHANVAVTNVSFKSSKTAIWADKIDWGAKGSRLQLNNFQVTPTIPKSEFMKPPHKQADYITIQGDEAQFYGFNMRQWRRDSTIAVRHVVVKNITTDVSRDKRLPDPAYIPDKLMPTRLIQNIKIPFRIDSISVVNSNVIYHETSKLTNRVGDVPMKEINGVLKNITNRPKKLSDSLSLKASTQILGLHIDGLQYRESYGDSLAGFRMLLQTSDVHLPELTKLTNPMIAANLDGGYVQPITARVIGNQYASMGNMRFHYKDLKITLLTPADTTKKTFLTKLKNFVIGKVIRKKNETDSRIFYDRDPQVFIFGYWIKTMLSGVMTSVGVKGNKKYQASYQKLKQQRRLPVAEESL